MNKLLVFIFLFFSAVACTGGKTCDINGSIDPDFQLDSCWIYLVPEGPHEDSDVDSCLIHDSGKFEFSRRREEAAIIRVARGKRAGLQELLVITEPGTVNVFIGPDSRCEGTPQNDSIQIWKELTLQRMSLPRDERMATDSLYKERTHRMAEALGEESTLGKVLLKYVPFNK